MRREQSSPVYSCQQPVLPLNSHACPTRLQLSRQPAILLVLALLLPVTSALAQKTIRVPADQPTIQAGIDLASTSDTVLVAPGTYFENIDFTGKAITVTSSDGAAKTILDGGPSAPTVTFEGSETRASVLSNFTIQHGGISTKNYPAIGGGISVSGSSPTILNNVISKSHCWGIQILRGAPLFQGNTISATQNPGGICTFKGHLREGPQSGCTGISPAPTPNRSASRPSSWETR